MSVGIATQSPMIVVMRADQMPEASTVALAWVKSAIAWKTATMPQTVPSSPRSGEMTEMSFSQQSALEVAVKEVAHLGAHVVGVLAVRRHDFVNDADERIGPLRINAAQATVAAALDVEEVALEVAPDGSHVEKLPENQIEREKRHENEHHARWTDHRVNLGEPFR